MHSTIDSDLIDLNTRVKCSEGQLAADLGGELAVLNVRTGIYYGLDGVGAHIWNLLKEARTVRELRDLILEEYAVDERRCEQDLLKLLRELSQHELVQLSRAADPRV